MRSKIAILLLSIFALSRVKKDAADLKELAPKQLKHIPSPDACLAFPDRIGKRRRSGTAIFAFGVWVHIFRHPILLATASFIVAAELDGQKKEAGISAIAITS